MTAKILSNFSLLAQASYANLAGGMSSSDIASALVAQVGGFTSTQAERFAVQQSVVLQYNDDAPGIGGNGSSLSVTVFKDANNNLTLAIRGTLESGDLVPTDDREEARVRSLI